MRGTSLVLAAALWAGPAGAGEFLPSLFVVSGVASNDVLNIRSAPDAGAEIVGTLEPDATDIEVTAWSEGATWGRVNSGDASGWVARRFLVAQDGPEWSSPEARLSCFGTEPFWDLTVGDSGAEYRMAFVDEAPRSLAITDRGLVIGVMNPALGIGFDSGFATIRPAECSDGMSDRYMAVAIELFLGTPDGFVGLTGCCSLTR